MAIADTSRGIVRYSKETVPGVTDASPLTELRFTGESLNQTKTTTTSNEIRADRQVVALIDTDSEPSGGIDYDLSYGNIDDFIPAALLGGDWSTLVAISEADLSVDALDNSYNTTAGDFTTENLSVGQWLKPAGFTDPDNNDYCKIVSITANKLIVTGNTLATESATAATFKGEMVRNGTTAQSFTLEKEFSDITQFLSYTGMEVDTLTLEIASNAIVSGSLDFVGRSAAVAQVTVGTGTANAALENDVFNATTNIANISEGGTALGTFVTAISTTIANGLRGQKAVTVDGNVGIGKSRCVVTGTLSSYFEDEVLLNKFLTSTETSISYRINDPAGNAYIVTLPKVKYTSGNPELGAIDSDVPLALDYQALRDPVTDCTVQVDRFTA